MRILCGYIDRLVYLPEEIYQFLYDIETNLCNNKQSVCLCVYVEWLINKIYGLECLDITLYPSLSFFSFFTKDNAVAAPAPPAIAAAAAAFRCLDLTRNRFVDGDIA